MFSRILTASRAPTRSFSTSSSQSMRESRHFINGEFVSSKTDTWYPLTNPSTGKVIGRVPEATPAECKAATDAAHAAFQEWRSVPVTQRVRTMYELRDRINQNMDKLSGNITEELGKVHADAVGDVIRGLEIVEHATSAAQSLSGRTQQQIAHGIDVHTMQAPMGVFGGVCPFNFPAMIPLWMFPMAIVSGNTFVLKPSEKDPGAVDMLAEISKDLWPAGVFNVLHGGKGVVDHLCDEPVVKGISFVGGGKVGNYIHERGSKNGKRVQANMAAKNHGVIMPDAQKERTLDALVGAAFGASGQRCMALPVVIFVGDSQEWIPDLVARAEKLKVGDGSLPDTDLGPVITPESLARIKSILADSESKGAKLILDGRNIKVEGDGHYIAPTIVDGCDVNNPAYTEELFGPVLTIMRADTLDEATEMINNNPYGNGTAIFTRSGAAVRKFTQDVEAGQIGVNLPIPVPPYFMGFTGSKASFIGHDNFYGEGGFRFYTQTKTVMSNWWADDLSEGVVTTMPVLGREAETKRK